MHTAARVGLLLAGPQPDDVERLAVDFCARGPGVELVPVVAGTQPPADVAVSVSLAPRPGCWHPTDVDGAPVGSSPRVVGAVLAGHPWVEVQLRDEAGRTRARGRVGTRRSVSATDHRMLRVVGPLIVSAVCGGPPLEDPPEPPAPASRTRPRTADARGLVRFAGRLARAAVTCREWGVARAAGGPGALDGVLESRWPAGATGLTWRTARGAAFWADPCLLRTDRTWQFVEELDRWTGRGHIRLLAVEGDDVVAGPVCRRTDHHLSFPQVYDTGRGWLATVETCAAHNPILAFDRPGDPWRDAGMGTLPSALGDPVLRLTGDEVTGLVATDATVDPDCVGVEFRRVGGAWQREDARTLVDVIRARGGGSHDDTCRAAQDCAGTYGRAVELTSWPEREPLRRIDGTSVGRDARGRRWAGVHTLTWTADRAEVWVDGWRRRIAPLGGLWRVIERRHPARCSG